MKRLFRATRKLKTPNLVSHITQRAAGKELVFIEDKDYLYMLWVLKEIVKKYSLKLYAFCLMPNHIHMLLSPSEPNLYEAMQSLFSRYAMKFNRKYERKGHLFGGPYRQAVCLDNMYLLTASLYIHLNPVRAGLADDPLAFRWSSCRLYVSEDAPSSFITPDFILNLLSGNKNEKKERYRKLLEQGANLKMEEVMEEKDAIDRFRRALTSKAPSFLMWLVRQPRAGISSNIDLLDIHELERWVHEVKTRHFFSKPESLKAKRFLIEQLIARGYNREEIAERLGISRRTVYNILKAKLYFVVFYVIFLPISAQSCFG
jgi:putative transposase